MDPESSTDVGLTKPYPSLENDKSMLLGLLCMDVWNVVLDRIKDDEVLESLSNTSLFFRQVLLSRRTSYLFPKIVNILDTNAAPGVKLYGTPSNAGFLNLRLVCKKWNQSIEILCKAEVEKYGIQHNFQTSGAYARAFLSHFKATHPGGVESKSPFLHPSVRLDLMDERNFVPIQSLLDKYGSHLLCVSIEKALTVGQNNGSANDSGEKYIMLLNWLKRICNVNVLFLHYLPSFHDNFVAFSRVIESNPLPDLPYLQKLVLHGTPEPITNAMLAKYYKSLKILLLEWIPVPARVNHENFARLNLKEFEITFKVNDANFNVFEKISAAGSDHLVSFKLLSERVYMPWFNILRVVSNRWGKTLERLYLELPNVDWVDCGFDVEKELSKALEPMHENTYGFERLKDVTLKLKAIVPLDFLYSVRDTLENLEIIVDSNYVNPIHADLIVQMLGSEKIRLFQDLFSLNTSSIWKTFPKLNSVKCSVNCRMFRQVLAEKVFLLRGGKELFNEWMEKGEKAVYCSREMV